MSSVQYPFIDLAVHERIRSHFAAGKALVLFSADMAEILWANGRGARLFGRASIYDLIEHGADRGNLTFRQALSTARGLTAVGDSRSFIMRMTEGFERVAVTAVCERIGLPDGEAILLAAPAQASETDIAACSRQMLEGFDDPQTHIAVLDGEGAVISASQGFAALQLTPQTLRMLVNLAGGERDRLVKRPVPTASGYLPGAIARLSDQPALNLVFLVQPEPGTAAAPPSANQGPEVPAVAAGAPVPDAEAVLPDAGPDDGFTEALQAISAIDEMDDGLFEEAALPEPPLDAADAALPSHTDAGGSTGPTAQSTEISTPDAPVAATGQDPATKDAVSSAELAPIFAEPEVSGPEDSGPEISEPELSGPELSEREHGDRDGEQNSVEPDVAQPAMEAQPRAAAPSFRPDMRATRFVWKIDAEGRFREISPELAAAVGPHAAEVVGLAFTDVAALFNLDPEGKLSELLGRRDTWSGKTIRWPIEGTSLVVPIDLAALPTYTRNRDFDGFRGFGIIRMADLQEDPHAVGLTLVAGEVVEDVFNDEDLPAAEPEAPQAEPAVPETEDEETAAASSAPDEATALAFPGQSEDREPSETGFAAQTAEALPPSSLTEEEAPGPAEEAPGSGEIDAVTAEEDVAAEEDFTAEEDVEAETDVEAPAAYPPFHLPEDAEADLPDETALSDVSDASPSPSEEDDLPDDLTQGAVETAEEDEEQDADEETDPTAPADAPRHAEPLVEKPALRIVTSPGRRHSDKVVRLEERRNQQIDQLSPSEQANFREIARRLDAFRQGLDATPADKVADKAAAEAAADQDTGRPANADRDDAVPADGTAEEMTRAAGAADEPDSAGEAVTPAVVDEADATPAHAAEAGGEMGGETGEEAAGETGEEAGKEDTGKEDTGGEADEPFSIEQAYAEAIPLRPRPQLSPHNIDQMPVALLVHAGDRLMHANPEFLRLTGYDTLDALVAVGGLDALLQRQDLEDKTANAGGMVLVRADDAVIPVTARLQSVRWDGATALILALMPAGDPPSEDSEPPFDVEAAEKHKAQQADEVSRLMVEVDELRAILDTATDGVVILGSDGDIRSMNRAASALFNYDSDETTGKPFVMLFAHESQKLVMDYLASLTGHGVASLLNDGRDVIGREASGGFVPLFMTIGHLTSSSGYCAVIRDITQWKRTEEELRSAKRAAETASAHKTEFLAHVSHEIRTPLNAIIGFADMMATERLGPVGHPRYVEYANDIGRSGRHVLDIVNDLLDISKIEAGEMDLDFASVGLNETVAEAVSLVQPQANGQRVIIRTALSQSVPPVVADLRSIKQIVLNILSNAIRFTPSGGQIVVSTAYEANGSVVLRVRDTGIGMTRAELDMAMKPFRQVAGAGRKRGDGTGLGLPLTKAMVDANRATFSIHSAPNEGTLVEITFPSPRVLAN
ncbi:ATP-binding protein [Rhizobium sp. SSA_523]|uniref:ATP-binding protein n=1 Tax=Rhizobium sp. SSA_523 TaxID=2952477 RepID=UPI0020907103|nr:ATP-binding protein [Rhizobium sp. SSA_523]MCO5733076.1 ATP-binding protein [Rhizobium sp. SSA_523]WKC23955.1 ATP-binding protein [Rhizobium sp. SSA_523]